MLHGDSAEVRSVYARSVAASLVATLAAEPATMLMPGLQSVANSNTTRVVDSAVHAMVAPLVVVAVTVAFGVCEGGRVRDPKSDVRHGSGCVLWGA